MGNLVWMSLLYLVSSIAQVKDIWWFMRLSTWNASQYFTEDPEFTILLIPWPFKYYQLVHDFSRGLLGVMVRCAFISVEWVFKYHTDFDNSFSLKYCISRVTCLSFIGSGLAILGIQKYILTPWSDCIRRKKKQNALIALLIFAA